MEGLHLSQKCFDGQTAYGIRSIVDVLAPELLQHYCVTHSDFLIYCDSGGKSLSDEECKRLNEEHDRFLLEELSNHHLKLFDRGFLPRFRDYLCGDWTRFYLISTRIPLATIQYWSNAVPLECGIFISCVDAAYWEVYALDPSLLAPIKEKFPDAQPCKLEDKRV
jgi:hypothetical protein